MNPFDSEFLPSVKTSSVSITTPVKDPKIRSGPTEPTGSTLDGSFSLSCQDRDAGGGTTVSSTVRA